MASLSGSNSIAWCRRFLKIPTQLLLLGSRKVDLLVLALASIFFKFCSLECAMKAVLDWGMKNVYDGGVRRLLESVPLVFFAFLGTHFVLVLGELTVMMRL